MNLYRRNFLVGVVVIGSLVTLGWMMLKFAGQTARAFTDPQVVVNFNAARADGLGDGAAIFFHGVNVGRVGSVALDEKNPLMIHIQGYVERTPLLPANLEGVIKSQSALGSASAIHLALVGDADLQGNIPAHGVLAENAEIPLRYVGLDIFPTEFARLADDLAKTSRQVRESNLIPQFSQTIVSIREQFIKAGTLIDSMQGVVGDPKLQGDVKAAVASFRQTADRAASIADSLKNLGAQVQDLTAEGKVTIKTVQGTIVKADGKIEDLSKNMSSRLEELSKLLESVHAVSEKINAGQGTAGQLVNDPKLYEGLVDSAKLLNATITDMQRLVQQWEQEGVSFKLK